jgi:hypothetical protein
LLRDLAAGIDDRGDFEDNSSTLETCPELVALQKLLAENSKELYPNCKKYTQLRFLIRLHIIIMLLSKKMKIMEIMKTMTHVLRTVNTCLHGGVL